jgi:hypothetical protein
MEQRMQKRRRFKHSQSFEERLARNTAQLIEQAQELPPGLARRHIMHKIKQNETAAELSWLLTSPPLQPFK